jgi:hypothetical protein
MEAYGNANCALLWIHALSNTNFGARHIDRAY